MVKVPAVTKTASQMIIIATCVCGLAAVVALFFPGYRARLFLGLGLGYGATLIKIWLLDRAVVKAADTAGSQGSPQVGMAVSYLLRFLLTAGALAGAVVISPYSFYAAAVGVLAMPASAYLVKLVFKQDYKDNPAGWKSPEEIDKLMDVKEEREDGV